MTIKFLHTADWQLGKPFAGVEDEQKRAILQQERLEVVKRLGRLGRDEAAEFLLVAGDLFDSPQATQSTVAAACSAIGSIGIPVFAIPGNHDFGGAGSLWEQEFFTRARDQLAKNFRVLLAAEPVELDTAVLFPCPLLRRHEAVDPTAWLRSTPDSDARFGKKPRIVVAHGSVLDFGGSADDEEAGGGAPNLIDLTRVPAASYDYIALGDWHGAKKVAARAWYSGTPELDRFVKGSDHDPGKVLVVEAERGGLPRVRVVPTARIGWHAVEFGFSDDSSIDRLVELVDEKIGTRAREDLLRLTLSGSLGIEAASRLEQMVEVWKARLLRVKLDNQSVIAPTPAELDELTERAGDPLISRVAAHLVSLASDGDDDSAVARIALRELHAACRQA
jgi:DNA repair exonuclease SbcCD nuclease subunit